MHRRSYVSGKNILSQRLITKMKKVCKNILSVFEHIDVELITWEGIKENSRDNKENTKRSNRLGVEI